MFEALLGVSLAFGILAAYLAGKAAEREQVRKFLRRAQLDVGWRQATPCQLAAMISVGQHYDYEDE